MADLKTAAGKDKPSNVMIPTDDGPAPFNSSDALNELTKVWGIDPVEAHRHWLEVTYPQELPEFDHQAEVDKNVQELEKKWQAARLKQVKDE